MKRLNPETGQPFKRGDVRHDGYVFAQYLQSKLRKTGYFGEHWISPQTKAKDTQGSKDRNKAKARARTLAIHRFKTTVGCVDCGYNANPEALQFDHLPGEEKLFGINMAPYAYSDRKVVEEIAKCEVVCANCHAIRTRRRQVSSEHASSVQETFDRRYLSMWGELQELLPGGAKTAA